MSDSLKKSVDSILSKMHNSDVKSKGTYGELAALKICEQIFKKYGGILIHSYAYKTVEGLAGNIVRDGDHFSLNPLGYMTEIDILLATPMRVFVIEVKSYKANKIILKNEGIWGCKSTSKSPVHQNEMHCRHLYPSIYLGLPDGMTKYIVPIVVFVDKATIVDERSQDNRDYIQVTILNRLKNVLLKNNTPVNNTLINIDVLEKYLRAVQVSNEKFLVRRK